MEPTVGLHADRFAAALSDGLLARAGALLPRCLRSTVALDVHGQSARRGRASSWRTRFRRKRSCSSPGGPRAVCLGDFTTWHFPRQTTARSHRTRETLPLMRPSVTCSSTGPRACFPGRRWWLDLYPPFEEHLRARHTVLSDDDAGLLSRHGAERRRRIAQSGRIRTTG